jgi:hypothetical protein
MITELVITELKIEVTSLNDRREERNFVVKRWDMQRRENRGERRGWEDGE